MFRIKNINTGKFEYFVGPLQEGVNIEYYGMRKRFFRSVGSVWYDDGGNQYVPATADPWTPALLPTAATLWTSAKDESNIIRTGTNITQWTDLSGNDNHWNDDPSYVPQYTGTVNGVTTPRVGNSKRFLTSASFDFSNHLILAVAVPRALTEGDCLGSPGNSSGHAFTMFFSSALRSHYFGSPTAVVDSDKTISVGNTYLIGQSYDGSNGMIQYFDGIHKGGQIVTPSANTFQFSNGRPTRAGEVDLAEVLFFDDRSAVSDADLLRLEGYLAWEWNKQDDLPYSHPYKNGRPLSDGTAASPANWNPAELTTQYWYNTEDRLTVTDVAGSVSAWADKSGNSRDLQQLTGANQPVIGTRFFNNVNAIDFSTDVLPLASNFWQAGSNDSMMIVAINSDTTAATQRIVNSTASGSTRFAFLNNAVQYIHNSSLSGPTAAAVTGAQILDGFKTGSSVTINRNANQIATGSGGTCPSLTDFTIGALPDGSQAFDGTIAEVVVLGYYSANDLAKLQGYMAHKYGLTADLPVDHPYKTNPPLKAS